jgi:antitoxin VapB
MALNIKDAETEQLVAEVADLTGKSKTAAVRDVMREERDRLLATRQTERRPGGAELVRFLREEIWPQLSPEERGRRLTKAEEEEILGIGPEGY